MAICSKCGSKIPEGTKFCPECGASIAQPIPQKALSWQCNNCGAKLPYNAGVQPKACPNCGMSFVNPMTKQQDEDKNQTAKAMAYAGVLLGIVATFLPFFKVSIFGFSETVNLWQGDYVFLSVIGIAFALFLVYELAKNKKWMRRDTICMGILIVIEIVAQYSSARSRLSGEEILGVSASSFLSPDVGFYLLAVSGIILFVAGAIMRKPQS